MKKVAVILSGCGVYDGSEIAESCAALLALHRHRAEAVVCAPSIPQMHVIDHLAGEPSLGEARNVLTESARIVRGEILPLDAVDPASVDAVLLPGGFGAAKNLSNFATAGADCTVAPQVEAFLQAAHAAGRPIGAMCIAPVILARVFGRGSAPQADHRQRPDHGEDGRRHGRPSTWTARPPAPWSTRSTAWPRPRPT